MSASVQADTRPIPTLAGRNYSSGFVQRPCGAWFRHCNDRVWYCWGASKVRAERRTADAWLAVNLRGNSGRMGWYAVKGVGRDCQFLRTPTGRFRRFRSEVAALAAIAQAFRGAAA